jgi:hypothetical protein
VHLRLGQAAWHPSKNHRGIRRIAGEFLLNHIAYNLVRIPKLILA